MTDNIFFPLVIITFLRTQELQPWFYFIILIYPIEFFHVCRLVCVICEMETYQQQGDVMEHLSALKS